MIQKYAETTDYDKYGSGKLNADDLEKYLELASMDINRATLTRIEKIGFNKLTEQQKYLITKATCIQADFIKEEGIYDYDDDVSSYSIGGDLTINEKEKSDIADKLKISKIAFSYLRRTGLTFRII